MFKSLTVLTLFPFVACAADMTLAMNTRGLPEDFRRYFYNSELIVQVYLNDTRLFDAAVALNEKGDIRLLRVIDDAQDNNADTRALWNDVLEKGVTVGKCLKTCPAGLMAVQYQLDNSALKLYTANYETARARSGYLSIPEDSPGGVILYNDASVTSTESSRSWGINSSLTSSLAGWSQKVSFHSSGTDGSYRYINSGLYEFYTQKELPGSFIRLGYFTPDNDTGNAQTSGFGYDTVVGAMWGTSDALQALSDSVSAWPVYVNGRNQSIAEVWRDGRLIHTQQLQSGVQALDTRQLPGGIYNITIKIIDNGQIVDTQQAQIYKPQGWSDPNRRWRMNFWSGQSMTLATGGGGAREDNPFAVGGGIDLLVHPQAVLGLSGAFTETSHQIRTRVNLTLSPDDTLFAQYTLGNTDQQANQNTDIRYYRTIPGGGAASLYWRSTSTDIYGSRTTYRQQGDTWGSSLSQRLPWSSFLIVNGQYVDTVWRRGLGADVSLTALSTLAGRDMNFRLSAFDRPGFNNNRRDRGIAFGVTISLTSAPRHILTADTGINLNKGYASLNYQWQPEGKSIRSLGGGVSYTPLNTVYSGNAAIDTPYINGDAFVQHNSQGKTNTLGGNLSQVLVIGGGRVASVNGNTSRSMESALIVDVESDDENTRLVASGSTAETHLKAGRNIVPVELWKDDRVQFSASDGDSVQILPPSDRVQLRRGGVKYIKLKAVKTFTLVGMLHDENGSLLKHRYVNSDVSGGVINAEGVLTLDSGVANRKLRIRAENELPAMQCELPADMERDKKVQFFSAVTCRTVSSGVNK